MGTLERLNLAQNRLAYLPPNMYLLHNLRELNVGHNDIVYLPEELSHLQQLHYLNIAANNLYSLPDSCGKLRGLKTLILCNNQLEVVSPRLGELSQLTWLDISWNRLDAFPRNLPESLKKLYAGNNRIRSIEGDVIRRLRNLKELSLPSNKLTRLPRELLDLVDSLKVLDVEDNRFSERDLTTTEILTSFTKARSALCYYSLLTALLLGLTVLRAPRMHRSAQHAAGGTTEGRTPRLGLCASRSRTPLTHPLPQRNVVRPFIYSPWRFRVSLWRATRTTCTASRARTGSSCRRYALCRFFAVSATRFAASLRDAS